MELLVLVGVGVALPVMFVTGMFDRTKPAPTSFIAISAGYHIVGLVFAGAILGLWR